MAQHSSMTSIGRYRFVPDLQDPGLQQHPVAQYQANRSHPERPAKDRREVERFPAELTAARIKNLAPGESMGPRQFVLSPNRDVKAVAYASLPGSRPATTGTSQPGVLCLTDGMGPCIAVAIGGEPGATRPGGHSERARVRVFHVFPDNVDVTGAIGDYVRRLQGDGLTVRAALHGGEADLYKSRSTAAAIRSLFAEQGVRVEFDESCERRDGLDTPLGAVVDEGNEVQFVTGLAQRPG
jgi:hypothetical protein